MEELTSIEREIRHYKRSAEYFQGQRPAHSETIRSEKTSPAADDNPRGFDRGREYGSLCELDLKVLEQNGYLTPTTMWSRLAEQYRVIKRPLLKTANLSAVQSSEALNIIAVTSAFPGEGKSFTTLNLAMSIAMERDVSVLVIDADLVGRSLTKRVRLMEARGLSDLLLDRQLDMRRVLLKLDVGNFGIIPAGSTAQHPSELLSSERMRDIMRELAGRYLDRIVLIDTAPLLTTSQAAIVSDLAGQVLFVVEEGKTSQQSIKDALALISEQKSIGLVLNKSTRFSHNNHWPYYGSS